MEKQSEKARQYLKLKEDLKIYDVNAFLLETDKLKADIKALDDKLSIANADFEKARAEYESSKAEYEAAEEQLNDINNKIDMTSSLLSDTELEKQRLEGSINVYNEQIKTVEANNTHYSGRINAINAELKQKNDNINSLNEQKVQLSEQLSQYQNCLLYTSPSPRD